MLNLLGKLFLGLVHFEFYNKGKFYFKLFLNLIIGLILVIVTFSFIQAKFHTVNILFLFLLIYSVIYSFRFKKIYKPHISFFDIKTIYKEIYLLTILSIPIFLFQVGINIDHQFQIKIPHPDFHHYAYLSKLLLEQGYENTYRVIRLLYPDDFAFLSPYHYFELWLNAFFIQFLPPIHSLLFVSYPILQFLCLIGIVTIWEISTDNLSRNKIIFSYFLLFVSSISFFYISYRLGFYKLVASFGRGAIFYENTTPFSFFGKKLIPAFVFGILSIIFFLKREKGYALMALLILPILNVAFLPAICFGLGGYLFLSFFFKYLTKKETLFHLYFLFGYFILFFSIYYFGGTTQYSTIGNGISQINFIQFSQKIIQSIIIIIIEYIFIIILVLSALRHFRLKSNTLKDYIIILCLSLFFGLIFKEFFTFVDRLQFLTNILTLLNILIITAVISNYDLVKNYKKNAPKIIYPLIISFVIIYNLFISISSHKYFQSNKNSLYSQQYLNTIENSLKKYDKNTMIGFLLNKEELDKITVQNFFASSPKSLLFYHYFNQIMLNNPDSLHINASNDSHYNFNNPINRYIKDNNLNEVDHNEVIRKAIDSYNIKIIVSSKEAPLYNSIDDLILYSFKDSLSGESIHILK